MNKIWYKIACTGTKFNLLFSIISLVLIIIGLFAGISFKYFALLFLLLIQLKVMRSMKNIFFYPGLVIVAFLSLGGFSSKPAMFDYMYYIASSWSFLSILIVITGYIYINYFVSISRHNFQEEDNEDKL